MEPGQSMQLLQGARNEIMAARDKLKASEDSHKQTKIELRQSVEEGKKQQKELDELKGQLAQANGKSQTLSNRVDELEDQLARARKLIVATDDELKLEKKLKLEVLRTWIKPINPLPLPHPLSSLTCPCLSSGMNQHPLSRGFTCHEPSMHAVL